VYEGRVVSRVAPLVRVRAEEVALGLGEVLGEVGGAVAVEVVEGRGEGGAGIPLDWA